MTHTGTFSRQERRWTAVVFITGLVLLAIVLWVWWHFVYSDPTRTFFAAVDNSLRTQSVSKRVTQKGTGQELEQDVELTLSPEHTVRAETTIIETGEAGMTTVQTETISTPHEDYVRYTEIDTDQKGSSGNTLDFSELVNIWGKTAATDKTQTTGELYGESVLGVVPIGDLPANERIDLMEFIREKDVFQFEEAKVKRELKDGRPVYTYATTVKPEAYVGMLKQFSKAMGLTQLESIDPSQYSQAQSMQAEIVIDVWAREVAGINYVSAQRSEQLGGYGLDHDVDLPKKTVPVEELQQRLQSIQ